MPLLILALLIGVPLAEIALFIEIGGFIGLWPTIATVILTAVLGTALLRQQGMATLRRAQMEMDAQRLPVRELFDGACLLVAGVLLLTPGFLTDAVGFILLVPPLRRTLGMGIWRALQKRGNVHIHASGFGGTQGPGGAGPHPGDPGRAGDPRTGDPRSGDPRSGGPVIEGEYEDLSTPRQDQDDPNRLSNPDGDDTTDKGVRGKGGDPNSPWRRDDG